MWRCVTAAALFALVAAPLVAWAQPSLVTCGPAQAGCGPAQVLGAPTTGGAAPSWVSSMLAAWMLDEAGTATRVNLQGTTTRDLTVKGTGASLPNDTTDKMEGTASLAPLSGVNWVSATDAAFQNLSTAFTAGCWAKWVSGDDRIFDRYSNVNSGFILDTLSGSYRGIFFVPSAVSITTPATANVWAHVVTRLLGGTGALLVNGVVKTSTAVATIGPGNTNDLNLGAQSGPANAWNGRLDECFVAATGLSDASVCRICSCGIRGEQCTCSGAAYTSTGRNATACGSCTLPANCSAAAPS